MADPRVVSEADPALRQPPVLEDFVGESLLSSPSSSQTSLSTDDESTPLLPRARSNRSLPWYKRPSPKLLIPFALLSALCRGMTLAPRVEVFTRIACDGLRIEPVQTHVQSGVELATLAGKQPTFFSMHGEIESPHLAIAGGLRTLELVHISTSPYIRHDNASVISRPRPLSAVKCRADPAVQQGAAKLQTLMITLTGALSALTAGFWGQFGDKHGRSSVIALSLLSMIATDLIFVLAASQSAHPAYGFLTAPRILMLAPLIEGSLGGLPTMQAAFNAYISDATPAGSSRAKIFSRFFGFFFVGVAAGPTLGNIMPYDAFWMSITLGAVNLFLVALFLPESLSREQRLVLKASRESLVEEEKQEIPAGPFGRVQGYINSTFKGTFGPMAILLPRKRTGQGQAVSGEDWSLTFLAISLALYLLTVAIYSVKFLYAEHVFGWGAAELSYYLSYMGTVRALNLLVIMPYFIKVYKPKSSKRSPSTESFPSHISPHGSISIVPSPLPARTASLPADALSPSPAPAAALPATPEPVANAQLIKRSVRIAREQQFDLTVARISMCMEFLSYFLLCSSSSQTAFVMTTTLSAFGGGTSPAMQSLALGILGPNQADVGKLFGALSMLGSIASTVLSPMLFGSIYSLTVAAFPKAIFVVATAVLTAALLLLALVQPARPLRKRDVEDFPPRGRSRRAKDLRRTYSG